MKSNRPRRPSAVSKDRVLIGVLFIVGSGVMIWRTQPTGSRSNISAAAEPKIAADPAPQRSIPLLLAQDKSLREPSQSPEAARTGTSSVLVPYADVPQIWPEGPSHSAGGSSDFSSGVAGRTSPGPLLLAGESRRYGPLPAGSGNQVFPMQGAGGVTQAQISAFRTGLEQELDALHAKLIAEIFGDSLPLLGSTLLPLAQQQVPQLNYLSGLKTALSNALNTLTGSASYTEAQVEDAIRAALTTAGISFGQASGVNLDASNAADLKLFLNSSKTFPALSFGLDGGLGLPGLGLETDGNASTVFNYTLNFSVGVDSSGFYLNTANNATAFTLGFATTLPGLNATANLSKIRFHLTDESGTDGDSVAPTQFAGTFIVDLLDPSGNDNRLRLSELSGDLLNATLSGNAAINLNLASDLGSARFPAISADLNFAWSFSNSAVTPNDFNESFGSVPTVAFRNITLDLGSFLTKFAKPVLDEVREVSGPLQPVIKAVKDPIPLLSSLHNIAPGVPSSILEIGVANGSITQEQADRFDVLSKIIQISQSIPANPGAGLKIDLGDFNLGNADPRGPNFNIAGITPNKIRTAVTAALQHPLAQEFLTSIDGFPKDIPGDSGFGQGLQFPILDKPETAFGLLLGKNVDLFIMDNSTQTFGPAELDEFVPFANPLGFRFQGMAKVRVDLDCGFDTSGLVQFANSGDPEEIFYGFYVKVPVNAQNQPIAMAELNADFKASLAINVVLGEVGAGGGLYANIHAGLADPDHDGRVHLDEFIDQFGIQPLCVFQADGAVDFALRAYAEIGIDPIEKTFEYKFPVGSVVDFSFSCADDPKPVLARPRLGNELLHIGPEAPMRQVGNLEDIAETFNLTHRAGTAGNEEISITYRAGESSSANIGPLNYGPITGHITAQGGKESDTIILAPDIVTPADLSGGEGLDELTGGAGDDTLDGGDDHDLLTGRAGNDTLLGGPGPDILMGGSGADVLNGGPDDDLVSFKDSTKNVLIDLVSGEATNDAAGDTFVSIEKIEGTPFNDTLRGTSETDSFFGLEGNDILEGREGDDGLEGGPGADQIRGGPGYDVTTYQFSSAGVNVNLLTGASTGGDAEGDVLDSIEAIIGSPFDDTLTGNDSDNYIDGHAGHDTINGGAGNDELHGGYGPSPELPVQGQPTPPDDTINGGPGSDRIFGDGNNDLVYGGDGDDFIDMRTVGAVHPPGHVAVDDDVIYGGPGNDIIYGSPENDTIDAGEGDDFVDGWGGRDLPAPDPTLPSPQNIPFPKWMTDTGAYHNLWGMGGDALEGGPGNDTVSFEHASARAYTSLTSFKNYGVVVNLATGEVGNAAWESTVHGFENVVGTDYYDDLTGDDGPNIFWPLRGGGSSTPINTGPDRINGAGGIDTLVIDFSLADVADSQGIYTNGASMSRVSIGSVYTVDSYSFPNVERLQITGAGKNDTIYNWQKGYDDILEGQGGDDFLGGYEGSDILRGGDGNDTLTAPGTFDVSAQGPVGGHDVLDGGAGDDLLDDFPLSYSGSDYHGLGANPLFELDGGPGLDTFAIDLSNQTAPVVWSDLAPTNLEFANGTYVRNCERMLRVAAGSGDDNITLSGRTNNYIRLNGGNDTINPGLGSDYLLGGPGDDLLILDYSQGDDDTVSGVTNYRRYKTTAPFNAVDVITFFEFERLHVTGTSKDDSITGGGGDDILTGGVGNDTLIGNGGSNTLDGGPGNDVLKNYPASTSVATNDVMRGGPGNDLLQIDNGGPPNTGYGVDEFDCGDGDDEVVNSYFNGSTGIGYATAGTKMYLDGGAGNDILSADFSNQSEAIEFTGGRDNSHEFADGAFFRHFEMLKTFNCGSGNDRLVFNNRSLKNISCGAGNDYLNPGLGEMQLMGGPGDDTLVLDFSAGDDASSGPVQWEGQFLRRRSTANAILDSLIIVDWEHIHFTGTSKGDWISGGSGTDVLKGYGGNDRLEGVNGDDIIQGCAGEGARGAAEIDQLTGGNGADVFILGDASGRFYDDGNPATNGVEGYAKITDFNPAQDKLRLFGPPSSYLLGPSPIAGVSGSALFHDSNGNGTLDPTDELIATLGTATINAANTLTPALPPMSAPVLADAGFTGWSASPSPASGASPVSLGFTVDQTLPAGVILEVQASSDLGQADPWRVVASTIGGGAWLGPAAVTTSSPAGGKVTVTVAPPVSGPVTYFRVAVRNL
ncbi:MAG TPA: calcium-binding protein [Verrucomicrobiales bacterium]|nr:calcium-binding protein [Verrucomicrobiales bacterium]